MGAKCFLLGVLVAGVILGAACGGKQAAPEPQEGVVSDVDAAKISAQTAVSLKILKAESVGYAIVNRFYWVRVDGRPARDKLLEISRAAIDQAIAATPATYHSITLHFVSSLDIEPGAETKKCYAKATFLPEGDWQKVGRVPIDGYGAYRLDCAVEPIK